ncbi:MAG: MmgE/PrpD family protein [Betaproteobacteria bacterium]|nr:MmgE/PrpD family protein [Betaproteobacteria bacterium]
MDTLSPEQKSLSVSRKMVRWANALGYAALPAEIQHESKRALVDAIGCAIGGYGCDAHLIAQRVLNKLGGAVEATVIGAGVKTSVMNAAVLNGIMLRYLDYNDVYVVPVGKMVAGGHLGEVIPGALAVAEHRHIAGKEFLATIVAGYELSARMLHACKEIPFANRGWNTDSRGAVVMPVLAGRLMGLTEEQTVNAVGISASTGMILGILDTDEEANTLAKNFRFPSATHRALFSAYLAEEGFTGPERVLEGQRGFVEAVFQGDYQLERLTSSDEPFHILDNRYKPFAAESTAHGHLSATLHLVKTHDLKPSDIEAVTVRAGSRGIAHTGDAAKRHPMDKETADHSSWYLTAVAIMDREVSPRQYSRERYTDRAVEALMSKITLEVASEFDKLPMAGETVIRTRSGATITHRVLHPKGTRENRMSDEDINDKFRDMAKVHMSDARIDQLLDQLWNTDRQDDMAALAPLLGFG